MLNLGVSTQRLSAKAGSGFTPKKLFDDGEEGFWYDISDIRTLKENSDGTVDVTTYGQSVGYIEDKSGNGNHARQSVTGARKPKYARHPAGGIRNLFVRTEEFNDGFWYKYFASVTTNAATAPDGTNTAEKLIADNTNNYHQVQFINNYGTDTFTQSIYAKAGEYSYLVINGLQSGDLTFFNLSNGTIGNVHGAHSNVTMTDVGNGWYRCSVTHTGSNNGAGFAVAENNGTALFTADGTSGIYIWGAQLEIANEVTGYQKGTTEYDVTEAGQPDLYYLKFDGTDDALQVDSFSATTQGTSAFFGYSSTNAGDSGYNVLLDIEAGRLIFASSTDSQNEIGYYDGAWNDITDDGDIKVLSFNLQTSDGVMRENGTVLLTDTGYAEKPLGGIMMIGNHHNSSVTGKEFGGNLYQVVLRSTECNDKDLEATEKFIATKTGVSSRVRGLATLDLNFGANTYLATNSNGVSM